MALKFNQQNFNKNIELVCALGFFTKDFIASPRVFSLASRILSTIF